MMMGLRSGVSPKNTLSQTHSESEPRQNQISDEPLFGLSTVDYQSKLEHRYPINAKGPFLVYIID